MFFTCSPMCSDPTHQHSNEHEFATESQDHLADITIAGLQKKSKGKAEKSGKKIHGFENIHVYPLVAKILGLTFNEKTIDGRLSVLKHTLK